MFTKGANNQPDGVSFWVGDPKWSWYYRYEGLNKCQQQQQKKKKTVILRYQNWSCILCTELWSKQPRQMGMISLSMWIILQQKCWKTLNFNQCLVVLSWNVTEHSCSVSISDKSEVPDSKPLRVFIQPRWVEAVKQHESGMSWQSSCYLIVLKVCFDS